MALTIPQGCLEQTEKKTTRAGKGEKDLEKAWKGDYSALESAAAGVKPGDDYIDGNVTYTVKSWTLERGPGGTGVLRVLLSHGGDTALEDVWTVQSVRVDKSIECYCGDDNVGSTYPSLPQLRAWIAEPDGVLAGNFQYRTADGDLQELSPLTQEVARKYAAGVRSVMRFYPQIRRRRKYAKMPDAIYEKLGYKNTPSGFPCGSEPGASAFRTLVDGFDWLKTDDGVQQLSDGGWERTEAWIGLEKGSIDDDLYGDNRWKMPHTDSDAADAGNNQGGNNQQAGQ